MEPHHRASIDRLREQFADMPMFPALIAGGSVMKGTARPDSDVDVIFVATDEEYARRHAEGELVIILAGEFADYEDGYVDGKVVNLAFLRDLAERGSEPARSAFVNAEVVYSHLPEVEDHVRRIPHYPDSEAERKMESFYAQVRLLRWFVGEAEKRNDRYLLMRAAADMVLYAGRLVLARNRILFPSHKWFMREVRNAPDQPDGFCDLLDAVLADPCDATAAQLEAAVMVYYDPDWTWLQVLTRFLQDAEWNWRDGPPPLADS